jgi:hypothetical protein
MRTSLLSIFAAASLLGCGIPARDNLPADAGRLIVCPTGADVIPVTVVDANGTAIEGATVKATHVTTGESLEGTTNAQGRSTTVTSELGTGTVRVTAAFGERVSNVAEVTWVCGDCNCSGTPSQVTLAIP